MSDAYKTTRKGVTVILYGNIARILDGRGNQVKAVQGPDAQGTLEDLDKALEQLKKDGV